MVKLLSTKEAVLFAPFGEKRGARRHLISYSFRVPTVYDRVRLRGVCLACRPRV